MLFVVVMVPIAVFIIMPVKRAVVVADTEERVIFDNIAWASYGIRETKRGRVIHLPIPREGILFDDRLRLGKNRPIPEFISFVHLVPSLGLGLGAGHKHEC
jgi:hypothetical protein